MASNGEAHPGVPKGDRCSNRLGGHARAVFRAKGNMSANTASYGGVSCCRGAACRGVSLYPVDSQAGSFEDKGRSAGRGRSRLGTDWQVLFNGNRISSLFMVDVSVESVGPGRRGSRARLAALKKPEIRELLAFRLVQRGIGPASKKMRPHDLRRCLPSFYLPGLRSCARRVCVRISFRPRRDDYRGTASNFGAEASGLSADFNPPIHVQHAADSGRVATGRRFLRLTPASQVLLRSRPGSAKQSRRKDGAGFLAFLPGWPPQECSRFRQGYVAGGRVSLSAYCSAPNAISRTSASNPAIAPLQHYRQRIIVLLRTKTAVVARPRVSRRAIAKAVRFALPGGSRDPQPRAGGFRQSSAQARHVYSAGRGGGPRQPCGLSPRGWLVFAL